MPALKGNDDFQFPSSLSSAIKREQEASKPQRNREYKSRLKITCVDASRMLERASIRSKQQVCAGLGSTLAVWRPSRQVEPRQSQSQEPRVQGCKGKLPLQTPTKQAEQLLLSLPKHVRQSTQPITRDSLG